ncbi:hypothetical protein PRNP1_005116 [Phytophthora ramorum]
MSVSKRATTALAIAALGGVTTAKLNVTVYLDATYAMDSGICSGAGDLPTGTACPRAGDVAIADCYSRLSSYNGTDCVAPVDAKCIADAESKWRCVFLDGDKTLNEDWTSTLTTSTDISSEESPWGDLPWRAPPPLDSSNNEPTVQFERDSKLQIQ